MKEVPNSVWRVDIADNPKSDAGAGRSRVSPIDREKFAEASGLAIVTADALGTITSWNFSAERIFGIPRGDAIGQSMEIIIPERFRAAHHAGIKRVVGGAPSSLLGQTIEVTAIRSDGSEFPISMSLASWNCGKDTNFGAFILDISARRSAEAKLEHRAKHDQLTRLLGPRAFQDELTLAMEKGGRIALVVFDLDGFKNINDTLGHAVGDALLQSLAVRLRAIAEPSWIIGRLGGDEFAIAFQTDAEPLEIRTSTRRFLKSLSKTFSVSGHQLHLYASLGIALFPSDSDEAEELMALADRAMFRAKRDGGRQVRLFDQKMRNEITAQRALNEALRTAYEGDQWELFFQPQFDLSSNRLVGAEALLRWRHPERGLIAPAAFLDVLDTHAVAFEVGQWVFSESCRQLAEWRRQGIAIPRVSCNLFAAQLHDLSLRDRVLSTLAQNGLSPSDIELEITEKIALNLDKVGLKPLFGLVESGIGVALDDFGTGFASLATLTRAPITQLKIDKRFVENIATETHSAAVVAGMVAISDKLEVGLIAEGVETAEQADALQKLGCNVIQGFLLGRSMSAQAFISFCARLIIGLADHKRAWTDMA